MINIQEIAFTCYPVADMAKARAFYEGVLGLTPTMVFVSEDGKTAWTEYEIGSGAFTLGQWAEWKPSSAGASIAFEVKDFDGAIRHLQEAGIPFKMEPFPTPVCRMAFVLDPDGSAVCIHQRHAH